MPDTGTPIVASDDVTNPTKDNDKPPHPIDVYVGKRVRARRRMLGLTQTNLGDALGVTFQQVQKYERGTNRLSASSLKLTADYLKVNVTYFYEGYEPTFDEEELNLSALATSEEGQLLLTYFFSIKDTMVRDNLLEMIRLTHQNNATTLA